IHRLCRVSAQANMHATILGDGRHFRTAVDPELGIFVAIANSCIGPFPQLVQPERNKQRGIKRFRYFDVPHGDGNVIDHEVPPPVTAATTGLSHAGAPDFTSLKMIESIKAWNDASMILADTPTVVHRSPFSSSLSISTRVTASVPPLRIRTR